MAFVEFRDVRKVYRMGEVEVAAVDGMTFDIERGELVVVVGPSGAGKTTLLNMLGGMDACSSGTIMLDGREISAFSEKELTYYRRYDIGFVFQFYNLVQNLTALENVRLPLSYRGTRPREADALARRYLAKVGLEGRERHLPHQLSGGQQQRVLLARALCATENLLLLDEPVTGLDPVATAQFYQMIQQLNENGVAVIMISHDLRAIDCARHVLHMNHEGSFWGSREEYKNSRYWNIISVEYEKGGGQSAAC